MDAKFVGEKGLGNGITVAPTPGKILEERTVDKVGGEALLAMASDAVMMPAGFASYSGPQPRAQRAEEMPVCAVTVVVGDHLVLIFVVFILLFLFLVFFVEVFGNLCFPGGENLF